MNDKKYTLLTCMDARIDPIAISGFQESEAFVIRNAGGRATPEAIESMTVTAQFFGSEEWWVIHHTDCLMGHVPEDEVSGLPETIKNNLFSDLEGSVREDINTIKSHNLVPDHVLVKGFIYDIEQQQLISILE